MMTQSKPEMDQTPMHSNTSSHYDQANDELQLMDYLKILWERRVSVVTSVGSVTTFFIILSLMMPISYQASTVLMPPTQNSASGILSSLTSSPLGGLLSQETDATMSFIAILKSRSVMEAVIQEFDLIDFYETENIEQAIWALNGNTMFTVEDEGTIRISVTVGTDWLHPDEQEADARVMSAQMANYFVEQLDIVNKGLQTEQASFQRMFIEGRYNQNLEDLKQAEDSLKAFQEEQNMIALPEQTQAAIEIAAIMKGQMIANDIQLGVMASTLNPEHPEIRKLKQENLGLKSKLKELDFGTGGVQSRESKLFPAFSQVPELGFQLMRLTRDVEIQNTLFKFLTQQYEEAKIQEAKDTPTVQILDRAAEPIQKYRPRRALIVVSVFLLMGLMNVVYVIAKTNYSDVKK